MIRSSYSKYTTFFFEWPCSFQEVKHYQLLTHDDRRQQTKLVIWVTLKKIKLNWRNPFFCIEFSKLYVNSECKLQYIMNEIILNTCRSFKYYHAFCVLLKKTVLMNIRSNLSHGYWKYLNYKIMHIKNKMCIMVRCYVKRVLKLSMAIDVMKNNYRIVRPVRISWIPRESQVRVLNALLSL